MPEIVSPPIPEVLLVSRPVAPARPDGTVELVRTLAGTGSDPEAPVRYRVLTAWGAPSPAPGARALGAAWPGSGEARGWRPLTFLRLLASPGAVLRHYFFTPTPPVVRLARLVQRLRPAPAVQTLCSTPGDDVALAPLVFAPHVVALSAHTRARLLAEGLSPTRVHWIPPAVPLPPLPDEGLRAEVRRRLGLAPGTRLLLYLGDWDRAGAAELTAQAVGPLLDRPERALVFACRPKGERHREVAAAVRAHLAAAGAPGPRIRLLGRISYARELAAAADLAVFPARRLPDKMDLPLALLQSLAAGVPALVAEDGPLADLVRAGAAQGVPTGAPEPLREATRGLLEHEDARRALGEAARRYSATTGSVAALGRAHGRLYRDIGGA